MAQWSIDVYSNIYNEAKFSVKEHIMLSNHSMVTILMLASSRSGAKVYRYL